MSLDTDKRILVTGANGFIGRTLVRELLGRGARVRALVRSRERGAGLEEAGAELVLGDVIEAERLPSAIEGCSRIVHLAGLVRAPSRRRLFEVNEGGCRRLARACLEVTERPDRFVGVSSLAAAGPANGRPRREGDPDRPVSDYGRSKLAGERSIEAELEGRVSLCLVRPPAVYGPGDRDVLTFFRMARRGWFPRFSGPDRLYSFIHAVDLARGLADIALAEAVPSRLYYLADPEIYTWSRLSSAFSTAVGRRVRMVSVPAAGLWLSATAQELWARARGRAPLLGWDKLCEVRATSWTCDPGLAQEELGFEVGRTIEDGLAQTAAWYREAGWL